LFESLSFSLYSLGGSFEALLMKIQYTTKIVDPLHFRTLTLFKRICQKPDPSLKGSRWDARQFFLRQFFWLSSTRQE
jgi:hypothetical protein